MKFWKMNGAGNDFLIINNLSGIIRPEQWPQIAQTVCERHRSVGADGLMAVEKSDSADYKMLFFNSDGSMGEMCGNGARCICRYGYETGLAGEVQHVETTAGLVTGWRMDARMYRVRLNDPTHIELDGRADIDGKTYFQTTSGDFDTPVADPLPIVRIDTENQAAVDSKETYVNGAMAITADGVDSAQLYNGAIQIRGRGNSTWGYPKKPYKIKLNKKADLFGMGANKHWVLIANYRDRTLMRNRLAADLSDHLGLVTMHSVFVRVYLNGQDVGVYDLCEQIRVGKTRVDIYDWEDVAEDETDLSGFTAANGYDTTGGFIIELNGYYDEISKFKTAHDVPLTVKSPEYLNTNDEMFTYLTEYIQDFEDAVYNKDTFTSSKGQHYSELFDVDDLVDYWLVNEFMGNLDSGSFSSTYMYKDIGGDKFHMGPVWDFDSSSGNYHGHSKQCPADQWVAGKQGKWYRRLYRDRSFVERLRERYWENRDFLSSMATRAEQYYTALYAEAATDHDYWKIPTTYLYDGRLLVDWLNDRVAFFDAQFETVDTAYASLNS
mgnify:CR=1 FL=1